MPVGLALAAAHRLFSYDKVPLALALVEEVLKEQPENADALLLLKIFKGESVPEYSAGRVRRLYYDSGSGMFFVGDRTSKKGNISFKTFEEAEKYLRSLK
jgi:hypothetical protein